MDLRRLPRVAPQFVRCYSAIHSEFLTKDIYPDVKRGDYGTLTDSHVQTFEGLLGKERVITDKDELKSYNKDWLKMVCGYSSIALRPKTIDEVSEIMKICFKENLAVCPQGGNTGLVGGSVPVFDEIVLSMSLMNNILDIDESSGTVSCEAGCVLERVDQRLADHGLMVPLDLGAKGSCQVGGNVATCAGGLRLIRYGSLSANTLGLSVVLANGDVMPMMNRLKKDNTGYHLRQIFVGSEGTLGIITGVVLQCPPKPSSVTLAFLGLNSYEDVLRTYRLARKNLSETLSSCEMFDSGSMESVLRLGLTAPIDKHNFYMVIESHGSHSGHDEEKMNQFVTEAMETGAVVDGTFTTQPSTIHTLWQLRERIAESLVRFCYTYKYDLSLPLDQFYDAVLATKERLKDFHDIRVIGYGHIGDGNLHLNIGCPEFSQKILSRMEPWLFEWTTERQGSISAEHGIGFKKKKYLGLGKSRPALRLMESVKASLDPTRILNPYKVI